MTPWSVPPAPAPGYTATFLGRVNGTPAPLVLILCLPQGQALRSALHYFCCPLYNDKVTFQKEMFRLGIKIPDRDDAWEEDGAFASHYQRHSSCDTSQCLCPVGREEAEENGPWQLLLCHSCGSQGTHQRCSNLGEEVDSWQCCDCSDTGTGEGCKLGGGTQDPKSHVATTATC
ncbi:PHD finger protein 7-like [Neopsephotus bourkii]|uniref:PHD finger protein 7-like n=1 Tax=Neopsephotus bourkii TaxID=309878 RepID=UPI002AA5AA20|nr:PHD finger protein 7-like [Neopsephotus bourkii]